MTGEPGAEQRRVLLTESLAWQIAMMMIFPPLLIFADRLRVRIPLSPSGHRRMLVAKWLTMPALIGGHAVGLIAILSLAGAVWLMVVGAAGAAGAAGAVLHPPLCPGGADHRPGRRPGGPAVDP